MLAIEQPAAEKQRARRVTATLLPAAPVLQRKCACGGTATSTDTECEQCKKKKLQRRAKDDSELEGVPEIVEEVLNSPGRPLDADARSFMEPRFGHDFSRVRVHTDASAAASARAVNALAYTVGSNVVFAQGQYAPRKSHGRKLLAHELTHVVQQRRMKSAAPQAKLEIGPVNDTLEQEADRFAEQVVGVSDAASTAPPKPPSDSKPRLQRAIDEQPQSATSTEPPAAAPIVDDEAQQIGPGQMHKTEFLDALRTHVCSVADAALASAGRTAQGCPMIERWIGRLRARNVQYIERGIRRYATPPAQASAQDYITAVGEKVREGVTRWTATGDISGVPPELMSEMMGGGVLGALTSFVAGIGSAFSLGSVFAKAKDGGVKEANPAAIHAQLDRQSNGRPLEGGVRSRMEAAFGRSFAQVRIHNDGAASQLSSNLNARAFTVGDRVAFAAGEYAPGTLIGDALIAHELAHVVQQQGGPANQPSWRESDRANLEEDADLSALGAMVALSSATTANLKSLGRLAAPRLRSGLKLQRCSSNQARPQAPVQQQQPAQPPPQTPVSPTCPPTLRNPRWEVSSDMVLGPTGSGCHFYLGTRSIPQPGSPAGLQGMGFTGNVDVAAGCQGSVHFVQYVQINKRALVPCNGARAEGICAPNSSGIDTNWVYPSGSNTQLGSGAASTITVQTHDSPGQQNISNPSIPLARICLDEEFVTYLVYEDPNGQLTSLGWMNWKYAATAWRDQGTCPITTTSADCRGWQVVGGGSKLGSDFTSGAIGPRPLDRNAPVVSSATVALGGGECPETSCVTPQAGSSSSSGSTAPVIQKKTSAGSSNDPLEQQADLMANLATCSDKPPGLDRMVELGRTASPQIQRAPAAQGSSSTAGVEAANSRTGLIVDDGVTELTPGQMHKTEFLEGLKTSACNTADSVLAGTGRTAQGCPFIERWINRLRARTSQHIERAIRRYAPDAAGARTATDYFAAVGSRLREGVSRWASTGEISGVPPELLAEMEGGGIAGAIGGVISGIAGGLAGAFSGIGRILAKAKDGGAREGDATAIQSQLQDGAALDSTVRSRMESAFGYDFSRVRVHADNRASALSGQLNARAFTIGNNIAFAASEYRPGTLAGDALIAHELAHVVQQQGGTMAAATSSGAAYGRLEEDADKSAFFAVTSLWQGTQKTVKNAARNAMPAMRSGLRLQRCGGGQQAAHPAVTAPCTPAQRAHHGTATQPNGCCTPDMLNAITALRGRALPIVQQALSRTSASSPSPAVATALYDFFRIRPGDPRVSTIIRVISSVAAAMQGAGVQISFACSDASDCGTANAWTGPTCSPTATMNFCGDYDAGVQNGANFLTGESWLKTMIHEHVHAACGNLGTAASVSDPWAYINQGASGGVRIFGDSEEFYIPAGGTTNENPAMNIQDADCYARFIIRVGS
jgi:uncharacterized protein DUF4157